MPGALLIAERMRAVYTALLRHHSPGTWNEYLGAGCVPHASTMCRYCNSTVTVIKGMSDTEIDLLWPETCKGIPIEPVPATTHGIGNPTKKAGRTNSRMRVTSKSRPASHGGRNSRGGI